MFYYHMITDTTRTIEGFQFNKEHEHFVVVTCLVQNFVHFQTPTNHMLPEAEMNKY